MMTNSFCLRTKTRDRCCRFPVFTAAALPLFRAARVFHGQRGGANRMETAVALRHGGCNTCCMGDRFFPSRHGNITLLWQRPAAFSRSEEHPSELPSLMRI